MGDRCSLFESIEVDTSFVKQYPTIDAVTTGRPGTIRGQGTALQDFAGVEGIAQAITDVVDGDHREENH
jgi:hypothetical protein